MLGPSLLWPLLWLAATIVAGVALAWALRGRRSPGPHCPACGYDMGAIAGTRCPECGRESASREALVYRRRRWGPAWAAALALVAFAGLFGRAAWRRWPFLLLPTWKVTGRQESGRIAVEVLETRDSEAGRFGRMLRVLRDEDVLLTLDGFYFEVGVRAWKDGLPTGEHELLADLTGGGPRDLVITRATGGSGGEATTFVFSLDLSQWDRRRVLEPVAVLPFPGRFEDVDGDGVREFVCGDNTYRYRWTSGAESPQPTIILRWDGRRFVADLEAMRQAAVAGTTPAPDPPTAPSVLKRALDLVYRGRGDEGLAELRLAAKSADAAMASTIQKVLEELPAAMRESPFGQEVEFLNADQPAFLAWMGGGESGAPPR